MSAGNDFDDFGEGFDSFDAFFDEDVKPKTPVRYEAPVDVVSPLDAVESQLIGKLEPDAMTEFDAVKKAMRDQDKLAAKKFEMITDSRYYVVVCFQSHDQRAEFMKKARLKDLEYCDGLTLAENLGVKLTSEALDYPKQRIAKIWERLTE